MPALRFGQHREPRDDVSPGLVGMVGVRIEPASRHGAILVGLAGLNRRGRLRGQAGAIGRIVRIERQQMHGHGIPFIELNTCSRMARAASGSRSYASIRMVMSASVMRHDNRQSAA